jgi:hypothetical protein
MKRLVLALCLLALPVHSTTRYVSKSGSDAYTGASWAQAWLTLTNVNDTTRFTRGDTAVFGTGVWRGDHIVAINGIGSKKTCYIDSMYYAGTYGPGRVAWIYGSDSLGGWTQIGSGNTYITTHTPRNSNNSTTLWQRDSLIWRQADSASVNSAGKWWYGNGHIVAYVYNLVGAGYDPDAYNMDISVLNGVLMTHIHSGGNDQRNVSVVGLGFKYQHTRVVDNWNDSTSPIGWDSCLFSHLYMSNVAGHGGSNPSLIYNVLPEGSAGYDYNRVVACSLGTVYSFGPSAGVTLPQTEETSHGNAITFYGLRYSVVDSNVFFGHQSEAAIYFKCSYFGGTGAGVHDTVRFNTFNCRSGLPYGVRIWAGTHHLYLYGNTFTNSGVQIGYYQTGYDSVGYNRIWNNTFYNCAAVIQNDVEDRGYAAAQIHNEFKYNVVYRSAGSTVMELDSLRFWDNIDSNLYYAATGTNNWITPTARSPYGTHTDNTWTQWQARGVDLRSINGTNPGFTDADNGNFARPSAGTEMNWTYGGKTWMQYGAIQNSATSLPTSGISGAVLISGEVLIK